MTALIAVLEQAAKAFDSVTLTPVSEQTGLPESQLRFVMVWFLNFPLCWCIQYGA